jgi:hypothetical protein
MKKQVTNPYLPSYEYIPDGEPHVFGDRVYVFGSHDRFDGKVYCELDYACWSAPVEDLSDWRYEGVIYSKAQDPDYRGGKLNLWAPDVCRGLDGKYYLFYCGAWSRWIGVARAEQPQGPYAYYGRVRYPDGTVYGRKRGDLAFDPGVFVDDDGRIWLYTGISRKDLPFRLLVKFASGMHMVGEGSFVMELEADMLTVKSHKRCLPGVKNSRGTGFEGHEFFEASSMRKFNGKYYYIYSSILSHELAYAVSDYPDREFVYGGTLHSNGNIGFCDQQKPTAYWGNNHGSVERIGSQYYIFGHRQTNGTEVSRQGVAEQITMHPDGSFAMAEMTSCGLNGGPLRAQGPYEGGIACVVMGKHGAEKTTLGMRRREAHPYITQDGPDRTEDPGQYVANLSDGCVAGYKYFALEAQNKLTLQIRAHRGKKGTGELGIFTDLECSNTLAKQSISFATDVCEVKLELRPDPGTYPLYIQYRGSGSLDLLQLTFE